MITPKDLYAKAESFLEPSQGLVVCLLLLIALITVWMMVQKNAVLRTFWLVYLLSP